MGSPVGAVQAGVRRIGLVRHFPVAEPFPTGWKTSAELQRWRRAYDNSPALVTEADVSSIPWSECICSDLQRAVTTAKALFTGPLITTPLLREAEFAEFRTGDLRLPVWMWRWVLRVLWMTGHASQRHCRDSFLHRVKAAADLLEKREGDILVVSHAGVMKYLSAELRARGFNGPGLGIARHATLYLFSRSETRE